MFCARLLSVRMDRNVKCESSAGPSLHPPFHSSSPCFTDDRLWPVQPHSRHRMAQERERAPNAWVAHPSARGGSSARGRGRRGRGGVDGSAHLSWRPTPDAESTAREDASTPRADHGTSPSSLGTPAFTGGASLDPFGDVLEPTARTTPSNQISTLEVLGEDSESRRKRFESTLTHNRYLEVRSCELVSWQLTRCGSSSLCENYSA